MTIRIGHAAISENGTIWGKPGRQAKDELKISNWSNSSSNPWNYVFRAKDPAVREKIAKNCEDSVANFAIGYSQNNSDSPRTTMWDEAAKVGWNFAKITKPCNTDCSAGSGAWIRGAGVNFSKLRDMYTGNAKSYIESTKAFTTYSDAAYTKSSSMLMRGDVLLRRNSGHSGHMAIVLDTAPGVAPASAYAFVYNCSACNIRSGPGTDYKAIATVSGNTLVPLSEISSNGWLKIEHNGNKGYCSPKYCMELKRAMIYNCSACNVRKGAGTTNKAITTLKVNDIVHLYGDTKKVLGTTWYKIYHEGTVGWVSGKYVKRL